MPVINYETLRFKRAERLKVSERMAALRRHMDLIFNRLIADDFTMSAREFNALVSEYRISERHYYILEKEHRKLSNLLHSPY